MAAALPLRFNDLYRRVINVTTVEELMDLHAPEVHRAQ